MALSLRIPSSPPHSFFKTLNSMAWMECIFKIPKATTERRVLFLSSFDSLPLPVMKQKEVTRQFVGDQSVSVWTKLWPMVLFSCLLFQKTCSFSFIQAHNAVLSELQTWFYSLLLRYVRSVDRHKTSVILDCNFENQTFIIGQWKNNVIKL